MMISAGQHANETTGVVGALRAANRLISRESAHFTISPQENPDGYEIHKRLCALQPHHMHHAARYTALGDDLEYRKGEGLYEKAIRVEAEKLTGAKLHVNLHGYPSHEWTRPLSGYVPRSFAMWTLPKGFFLIIRHHASWERQAEELIDRVTKHLAAIDGLVAYNNAQIRLFEQHAGETGFRIINGFPCLVGVDDRHTVPLTLITEYPDETIYGDAFVRTYRANGNGSGIIRCLAGTVSVQRGCLERVSIRLDQIGALKIINADTLPADDFDGNLHLVNVFEDFRMNEFVRVSLMDDLAVAHGNDMVGVA